ncbi:CCA tRNA nucleotidyltransferase [Sulfurimonas sp.]|uniref:CCA tRNA nucleotidyltransferase n=1 Tax=Sulfurimonas sp. TaxID=2022749 RepID=UPI0025ED724D|nr:CCA tRNA nucleotidyltransferase [Sulfurimonas sp.]MDD5157731.1 CCA tRNA nucleotidyltransferase [Sulfurimonas sp.]
MITYPKKLEPIFSKLISYGIKPIIVGGFIRDSILNITVNDIDIELYGISSLAELENILKEFGSVNSVGKSFGVCKLSYMGYELDFTLPRIDNKTTSGHRGFSIKIDSNLDFKTAASRRDFTINTIGYNVVERKIVDPFNGTQDLSDKILRAVNPETFIEDPLRVLRAVRFSVVYDFKIDNELYLLCRQMVKNRVLEELPKERIFEEIKKILLICQKPSIAFELLKSFGSDIFTDNLLVVDEISKQLTNQDQTKLVLMLAGLCYDFTKERAEHFLWKFTNEKELLKRVFVLIELHGKIEKIYAKEFSDYALYKLATKVNISELLILSRAVYFSKNYSFDYDIADAIEKRARELNILTKKLPPLLSGKDILTFGIIPSPEFTIILSSAYEAQISGKIMDRVQAISWLEGFIKFYKKL